jgi:hypothetical protein
MPIPIPRPWLLNDKLLLLVLRRVASSFEEIAADGQGENVGYRLAGRLPESPCFFGFENTTVLSVDTEIHLSVHGSPCSGFHNGISLNLPKLGFGADGTRQILRSIRGCILFQEAQHI